MHGVTRAQYSWAVSKRRLSRQEGQGGQEEPEGMEPSQVAGPSNKIRLAVILVIAVIIVGIGAVVLLQHPTPTGVVMTLQSGKVTEANSADIVLVILLQVHNTSNKNITYWGASYLISQNGQDLTSSDWFDNLVLTPGGTHLLNETIVVNLGDVVVTTPITGAGTWELKGTASELVTGTNVTQSFDFNFATQ